MDPHGLCAKALRRTQRVSRDKVTTELPDNHIILVAFCRTSGHFRAMIESRPNSAETAGTSPTWRRLELPAALVITAGGIALHSIHWMAAGGLWRDEAAAVALAQSSTVSAIWERLSFEVMPLLVPLLLRVWSTLPWFASDAGLRMLGLAVGVLGIASIWVTMRVVTGFRPLVSLALVATNSAVIVWGDAIRPYGLASLLSVLTIGTYWRLASTPGGFWLLLSSGAAMLSVQSSYLNVLLLCATCAGALAVAIKRGDARAGAMILGSLGVSAIGVIPYWSRAVAVGKWSVLVTGDASIRQLLSELWRVLASSTEVIAVVWLVMLSCIAVITAIRRRRDESITDDTLAIYAGVCIATSLVLYILVLEILDYVTYAWHYLPLIVSGAVYTELALIGVAPRFALSRVRILAALMILGAAIVPASSRVAIRHTNVDLIAERLRAESSREDLIIMNPWYYGISFQRYYTGPASVTAIPDVGAPAIHRYDKVLAAMETKPPVDDLCEKIRATSKAGGRIWIVGDVGVEAPAHEIVPLPPPEESGVWRDGPYLLNWWLQVHAALEAEGYSIRMVAVRGTHPVSRFEDIGLIEVSGHKSSDIRSR